MSGLNPVEVVVVGAGYAGAIASNRLLASLTKAERRRVRVRGINPRAAATAMVLDAPRNERTKPSPKGPRVAT